MCIQWIYLNTCPALFSPVPLNNICNLILSTDTCTIYAALILSAFPYVLFLQMFLIFRNRASLRYATSNVSCFLTCTETNIAACWFYVWHLRHTSVTGVGSCEWCSAHTRWSWLIVSSVGKFTAHCNPPATVLMLMRVRGRGLSAHRALSHLHMNLTERLKLILSFKIKPQQPSASYLY